MINIDYVDTPPGSVSSWGRPGRPCSHGCGVVHAFLQGALTEIFDPIQPLPPQSGLLKEGVVRPAPVATWATWATPAARRARRGVHIVYIDHL